jgi:thiol:disulfide interchange protein DsbA
MSLKRLWILALLALSACGGPTEQGTEQGSVQTDPAANQAVTADPAAATSDVGAPATGRFELGVHYMRLSPTQPTSSNSDQVEVCEVFWYGCPHCFDFDPALKRWLETKPDNVSFIRVPAVWNPLLQLHARAFYTAEALGKGAEIHDEFFREIHERRNMLASEEELAAFFGRFNVDAAAFKTAFDSFEVHAKLQRADELSRRYRIQSVPTIVVNGKYTTGGGEVGSWDELLALIDELVAAEQQRR